MMAVKTLNIFIDFLLNLLPWPPFLPIFPSLPHIYCLLFICLSVGHLLAKANTMLVMGIGLMVIVHIEAFREYRLCAFPPFALLSHVLFARFIFPVEKMVKDRVTLLRTRLPVLEMQNRHLTVSWQKATHHTT